MTTITESRTFAEAAKPSAGTGMLDVLLINEGWGSSGYYPAETLQEAARDNVFPAGTQMFINHPTRTEAEERPVRDLNFLAAVLTEDATYDAASKGLRGKVKTFPAWRESLAEMAPYIGVSIRAAADIEEDVDVDGRTGDKVTRILEGLSVDFVTRAGRGGKVVEVLESAIDKGLHNATPPVEVKEALQSDVREAISKTVRKAYGKPYEEGVGGVYVWLRDYDDDANVAYFTVEDEDYKTYSQTYDESFNLTGDRTEVRATTIYVPVAAPSGSPTTSTESAQEDKMTTLEEATAQVTTLSKENAALVARAEEAERELRRQKHLKTAEGIVAEAFNAVDVAAPKTAAALATQFTLTESGEIDTEALKTLASEAAAELAEARGAGTVTGNGHGTVASGDDISESDLDAGLARLSGRKIVKEA
jgi:hypothetical protein